MELYSHSRVLITGDSFVEGVGGSDGGWAQRLGEIIEIAWVPCSENRAY